MEETVTKQHTGLLSPMVDRMRIEKVVSQIPHDSHVIDIGCGSALLASHLPKSCSYVGVDKDPEIIKFNQKRFSHHAFHCFDVCGSVFPFPSDHFSVAVLAAFLAHIDNPKVMLTEVRRVLRPEGLVVITTPSQVGGWVHNIVSGLGLLNPHTAEEQKGFFNKEKMKAILESTGLELDRYEKFEMGLNQIFVLKKMLRSGVV